MKRRFTALTTHVELTVDDDLGVTELAALLVDAYPETTEPPTIAYHLTRDAMVAVDRYSDPVADISDLVPLFELDLYHEVARRASPGWLLHAAALERDGRAYVFAGPSGAGKTTLTLALLVRGWRLVTEEIVLIDRECVVRGLARPIHTENDAVIPSAWRQLEYPIRGGANRRVAHPPIEQRVSGPLPLAAIARIGHTPDARPSLDILSPHAGIGRLWECTLRQDDDGLAAAAQIVANAHVYELASGSVSDATTLADQL